MSTFRTRAVGGQLIILNTDRARIGACLDPSCDVDHFARPKVPGNYVQAITCPQCGEPVVVGVSSADPYWLYLGCADCALSLAVAPLMPLDVACDLAEASPPRPETRAPSRAPGGVQ